MAAAEALQVRREGGREGAREGENTSSPFIFFLPPCLTYNRYVHTSFYPTPTLLPPGTLHLLGLHEVREGGREGGRGGGREGGRTSSPGHLAFVGLA
jgi:hypothetical protein